MELPNGNTDSVSLICISKYSLTYSDSGNEPTATYYLLTSGYESIPIFIWNNILLSQITSSQQTHNDQ